MNAYRWSIVVALLFLPLDSSARELTLGVGFEGAYDSNVFSTEIEEVDDYTFRIQPDVLLEDHEGELHWGLRYRPAYDYFIDTVEKRDWTHLANGELSWQVNPRTRLELSDRFGRFQSVNRFNELVTTGVGDGVVDATAIGFRDNPNTRNTIDASLTHSLGPTRMLNFQLGHDLTDFDREESSDRQNLSVAGRYTQTVSLRNQLGGGVSYRRASYDASSARDSQSTDFYTLFGSWVHQFDETLELSLAVGPTWVKSDDQDNIRAFAPDSPLYPLLSIEGESRLVRATSCSRDRGDLILDADCDVIDRNLTPAEESFVRLFSTDLELVGSVPSGSNSSLTYFANLSLRKRWEQWSGTISYRRENSSTSGFGSSTVADIVNGVLEWTPSPRWRSSLRVAVTRQSLATNAVGTTVAVMPTDLSPLLGSGFTDVAESFALRAVEIDQDDDILTLWFGLDVRYRLTERTTLYSTAYYIDQNRGGDSAFGREYDRFRVAFGVEYRFDPIQF